MSLSIIKLLSIDESASKSSMVLLSTIFIWVSLDKYTLSVSLMSIFSVNISEKLPVLSVISKSGSESYWISVLLFISLLKFVILSISFGISDKFSILDSLLSIFSIYV